MRILILSLALLQCSNLISQNYYVQISGDRETRVVDICGSAGVNKLQLAAYNVQQNNGNRDFGIVGLDPSISLLFSKQFHLPGYALSVEKIMPIENQPQVFILVSKISLVTGDIDAPLIINFDLSLGSIVGSLELPQLPIGYSFSGVYDIEQNKFTNQIRVLCTGYNDTGIPKEEIFEAVVDLGLNSCQYKQYSPQFAFTRIDFISFVRNYHESVEICGETSISGMARQSGLRKGFIIYRGLNQLGYTFETYQLSQSDDLGGFIVNGNSPTATNDFLFTMLLSAGESANHPYFSLQQKDGLSSTVWQRFYQADQSGNFNVSRGRGGHGVKDLETDYFPGHVNYRGQNDGVTILRYDRLNGDVYSSPEFRFTNTDLKVGYPNFCRYSTYFFLADRYVPQNGFKLGIGDTQEEILDCTNIVEFKEVSGELFEEDQIVSITLHTSQFINAIQLQESSILTQIIPECDVEQRVRGLIVASE